MRKLLIAALILCPGGTLADVDERENMLCQINGSIAAAAMTARQKNMRISDYMDILGKTNIDPDYLPIYRKMAVIAYKEPGYTTEAGKQAAVDEFSARAESECYDAAETAD